MVPTVARPLASYVPPSLIRRSNRREETSKFVIVFIGIARTTPTKRKIAFLARSERLTPPDVIVITAQQTRGLPGTPCIKWTVNSDVLRYIRSIGFQHYNQCDNEV